MLTLPLLLGRCSDKPACGDCGQEGGWTVAVLNQDLTGGSVALFKGWRAGNCTPRFEVCLGKPDIPLGDVDWAKSCDAWDLVAFARGFAPTVVLSAATTNRVERVSQGIELRDLVSVPVTLWVLSTEADRAGAVAEAAQDADEANRVFSEFGAGIRLEYGDEASVDARWIELETPDADVIGSGCTHVQDIRARATVGSAGRALFDEKALNVYYLPGLTELADRGVNCQCAPDSPTECWHEPKISFVGRSYDIYGVLPHEIGHALGLTRPFAQAGHSNAIGGFGTWVGNLMNSGVTEVTNITIGQSYRVHFDSDSWLNRFGPQQPPALALACGEKVFEHSPCPPVNLRAPGVWP